MATTTNYKLAKFDSTSAVDLLTTYNPAMDTIDAQLKTNADAAASAATAASTAQTTANTANSTANSALEKANAITGITISDDDKAFNVSMLAGAKISAEGIVYYKAAE